MCEIMELEKDRRKKLKVIRGLMKLNGLDTVHFKKLVGLAMNEELDFGSGQIATLSTWTTENSESAIKFATEDPDWCKTKGQKLFLKKTLEKVKEQLGIFNSVEELTVVDNPRRGKKRRANMMSQKSLSETRATSGTSRKRKKMIPRKSSSRPESSSYYGTLEVTDDVEPVEETVRN